MCGFAGLALVGLMLALDADARDDAAELFDLESARIESVL